MPQVTETELKKQLDAESFAPVYFFYGPETYIVSSFVKRFLKKAGAVPFPDFNVQRFDGGEATVDAIADAVESLPFMAERKCVTVCDFDVETCSSTEQKKLYELLDRLSETTSLLFYCTGVEVDIKRSAKWKKFIAEVAKKGIVTCMERRTQPDLEKLLCAAASKRGCELSRQDAARLIDYAGNDLETLYHEMEKLCSYVESGSITREVIDKLATRNLETTVFMLGKAIVAGNYDKAYQVLDLLFYQNEEPVNVLAALSAVYLDLYRVRAAVQSGFSAQEPAKYFDYKKKEFRLRNAERDVRPLSLSMLRGSLNVLLETDVALKSARGNRRIMMDEMIARLLIIAQKEKIA